MSGAMGRFGRVLSLIAAGSLLGSVLAAAPLAHAEETEPTPAVPTSQASPDMAEASAVPETVPASRPDPVSSSTEGQENPAPSTGDAAPTTVNAEAADGVVTGRVLADDPSDIEVVLCYWDARNEGFECWDDDNQTYTDDQGRYSFRNDRLSVGTPYAVRFVPDEGRYWQEWLGGAGRPESPAPGNHVVVTDPGVDVAVPDVTLAKVRYLTGRVMDTKGASVPEAWVGLYRSADEVENGDSLEGNETDGDGNFRIRIPREADQTTFVLAAWPEDADPQTQEITLTQLDHELSTPIVLPATTPSVVSGLVLDAEGHPLPGVTVTSYVWYSDDEEEDGYFDWYRSTTTDDEGRYTVRVRPGRWFTVRYELDGYFSRYLGGGGRKPATLNNPAAVRQAPAAGEPNDDLPDVKLEQAHPVEGTVVATGGEPVERVRVLAYPAGQRGEDVLLDLDSTDEDGSFHLELPAGTYDLVFDVARSWPLVSATTRTITVPETSNLGTIELPYGGYQVSGKVISGTGTPVAGATVRSYLWDEQQLSGRTDGYWDDLGPRTVTDADGRFTLRLGEGAVFTVRVQRSGYQLGWLGSVLTQPERPGGQLSAVSAANLVLPDITLFPSSAKVGKVAGQDLAYCNANSLQANDDDSSSAVPIPFPLRFFGQPYQSLYVNNNGNVSFEHPLGQYTPGDLTSPDQEVPVIAAFFADVDTRNAASFEVTYGSSPDGKTFCVNWANVGYYSRAADKLNIFQLLLTSRSGAAGRSDGDFDITMNYDQIQWETGNASNGSGGVGGTSAGVGYTAGSGDPGTYFELEGSRVPGSFLDAGTRPLVHSQLNSGQVGRYRYEIRNSDAAVQLGGLRGSLTKAGDHGAVAGATVNACRIIDGNAARCQWTTSLADGSYSFATLPAGSYEVAVSPPGTLHAVTLTAEVRVDAVTDLGTTVLTAPVPIPSGTSLTSLGVDHGIPVVDYSQDLAFKIANPCTAGTPAGTWKVLTATGNVHRSGVLAQSGTSLIATIPKLYPYSGAGQVVTEISCGGVAASSPAFDIYIDPSGTVYDQYGVPVTGAKVTLMRADSSEDPLVIVPDGSTLMSAGNRRNPDATGAGGGFHWDVVTGWYQLKVEKAGCTTYTSPLMEVPPERIDLAFRLTCSSPSVVKALSISGKPAVGSTLTAQAAEAPPLAGSGLKWLRGGVQVGTGPSYLVGPADSGATLTVQQTLKSEPVTNHLDGTAVTFEPLVLTATAKIEMAAVSGAKPTVKGSATLGSTVTLTAGSWGPAPVSLSYQWKRNGVAITGATGTSYRLTFADWGKTVSVAVTGSKAGYLSTSVESASTAKITGLSFKKTYAPSISGKAKVGSKLTAKVKAWSPKPPFAYQWLRNGQPIAGATKPTYVLQGDDAGKTIKVRVTAQKEGYAPIWKDSKATKKVAKGSLTAGSASISGTAKVGSALTAKPGTWKPAPVAVTYQWLRNGKAIKGATNVNYVLTIADKGKKISVKVTGSKTGYAGASRTSKVTGPVKA